MKSRSSNAESCPPAPSSDRHTLTVLHLVGGADCRGGVMSYVRQLAKHSVEDVRNFIWKHRAYVPENDTFVCRGWAKKIDISIGRDALCALLDFLPLFFWLKKNRPAILHVHTRMGILLSSLVCKMVAVPIVIHVHGRWSRIWFHRFLWRWTRAQVIFNSKGTCLHYGCRPEVSEIMMPTVQWPVKPLSRVERPRFVASSSFFKWKNVHLMVEAFNLLSPKTNCSLHIYGLSPTPIQPDYQQSVIEKAARNPAIALHPWDFGWTDQLTAQDIFVHAAQGEPFGIVILEAFSRGCKMVVPHGTFLDDLPEPYRTAGVFRAESTARDLSAKLKLAQEDAGQENLWELRKKAAPAFSSVNAAERLFVLYRSALK